jgi:hypothetical protein
MQACCLQDNSCVNADSICCVNELGGTPQGAGTVCTATEACCFPDGSCLDLDPLCCTDIGGAPQGIGTNCATTVCPTGWQPGDPHKMHFPQLPDEAGWDVNATEPLVLADDWECSETGCVKDIHFWGSWKHGLEGNILFFVLSIHEDIPADQSPTGYSMPGATLWERDISEFNPIPIDPPTAEGWYNPRTDDYFYDDHQAYYQYNVYLDSADWFVQDSGTIYWLNISAVLEDTMYQWGWKSSQDHWNDDAVWAFWGILDWTEMYEPGITGNTRVNDFWVAMNEQGFLEPGLSGGVDAFGDQWFYYEWYDWWNVWFYDDPFDTTRWKTVHLEFDVFPYVPGGGWFEIAVNWSTDSWSIDQEPQDSFPPLPGVDEDLYIGREVLYASDFYEGHLVFDWDFPHYNPEWISVDVRGFNFIIPSGFIEHTCWGQQSLDLAFVITGDTLDCELSCCGKYTGGFTGNTNCDTDGKRNLADITRLIDRVYVSGALLCCEPNGNTNGDPGGLINLADITRLIDHVYVSGAQTAPCP